MNNRTFQQAMQHTTATEKAEFEIIKTYLGLKQAETEAISAYYQELKHLDPNFKKWLNQQGE